MRHTPLELELMYVLPDILDVRIMALLCQNVGVARVATTCRVTQGLVRHRALRSLGKLEPLGSMSEHLDAFRKIRQNLQSALEEGPV